MGKPITCTCSAERRRNDVVPYVACFNALTLSSVWSASSHPRGPFWSDIWLVFGIAIAGYILLQSISHWLQRKAGKASASACAEAQHKHTADA